MHGKLSILIVDDIRAMRALFKSVLNGCGMITIWEAADGGAALDILSKQSIDIVITDLCMAPIDGITFVQTLRSSESLVNRTVPVLMVSGHTELSRVKQALQAGVTEFLMKPVSPIELMRRIQAILKHRRPIIRAANYCGPDRRHRKGYGGNFRRSADVRASTSQSTLLGKP